MDMGFLAALAIQINKETHPPSYFKVTVGSFPVTATVA
jgi:hypothetical protein